MTSAANNTTAPRRIRANFGRLHFCVLSRKSIGGDGAASGKLFIQHAATEVRKGIPQPDTSSRTIGSWCREGDSNPHAPFEAADFKSAASASSAIPANCRINYLDETRSSLAVLL